MTNDSALEPYLKAREKYKKWCSDLEIATPIEFGSVKSPGLSDLDLGLVFKHVSENDSARVNEALKNFPSEVSSLMNGGTLMMFPEKDFRDILLIDDITVSCLDRDVSPNSISDETKALVSIVQVVEWLPERIVKIYTEHQKADPNIVRLVGFLYSLCYSLIKTQSENRNQEQVSHFVDAVYLLRSDWLSLDQKQQQLRIDDLVGQCIEIYLAAIKNFLPTLKESVDCSQLSDELIYNLYGDVYLKGAKDWSDEPIQVEGSKVTIKLPYEFLASYLVYSGKKSDLGKIISRRFNLDASQSVLDQVSFSPEMFELLTRRKDIFSNLFDFVRTLNCGTGLYKFGWYLKEEV